MNMNGGPGQGDYKLQLIAESVSIYAENKQNSKTATVTLDLHFD